MSTAAIFNPSNAVRRPTVAYESLGLIDSDETDWEPSAVVEPANPPPRSNPKPTTPNVLEGVPTAPAPAPQPQARPYSLPPTISQPFTLPPGVVLTPPAPSQSQSPAPLSVNTGYHNTAQPSLRTPPPPASPASATENKTDACRLRCFGCGPVPVTGVSGSGAISDKPKSKPNSRRNSFDRDKTVIQHILLSDSLIAANGQLSRPNSRPQTPSQMPLTPNAIATVAAGATGSVATPTTPTHAPVPVPFVLSLTQSSLDQARARVTKLTVELSAAETSVLRASVEVNHAREEMKSVAIQSQPAAHTQWAAYLEQQTGLLVAAQTAATALKSQLKDAEKEAAHWSDLLFTNALVSAGAAPPPPQPPAPLQPVAPTPVVAPPPVVAVVTPPPAPVPVSLVQSSQPSLPAPKPVRRSMIDGAGLSPVALVAPPAPVPPPAPTDVPVAPVPPPAPELDCVSFEVPPLRPVTPKTPKTPKTPTTPGAAERDAAFAAARNFTAKDLIAVKLKPAPPKRSDTKSNSSGSSSSGGRVVPVSAADAKAAKAQARKDSLATLIKIRIGGIAAGTMPANEPSDDEGSGSDNDGWGRDK